MGGWAVSTSGASASLGSGLDYAAYNSNLGLGASSVLMFDTTVRAGASGTSAGVVFDYYDSSNFKFAAIVAGTGEEIAHRIAVQSKIVQILTPEQRAQARENVGKMGPPQGRGR